MIAITDYSGWISQPNPISSDTQPIRNDLIASDDSSILHLEEVSMIKNLEVSSKIKQIWRVHSNKRLNDSFPQSFHIKDRTDRNITLTSTKTLKNLTKLNLDFMTNPLFMKKEISSH